MGEQNAVTSATTDGARALEGQASKNPVGRPRGTGEADKIRKYLEPKKQAVLDKLAELAQAGDGRAQETFLRYFSPGARQEDEKVVVAGFAIAPTLQEKSAAVMTAISAGEISAAAGHKLLQTLETHVRIVTASDLERRLLALERGAPKPVTIENQTGAVLPDNSDLA